LSRERPERYITGYRDLQTGGVTGKVVLTVPRSPDE
jgi:hypothetical protein